MSGRGQHFIPRHFLRAFVIPDGQDKLWMYRRGAAEAVAVARDDAAKRRDFYSAPSSDGLPTLDDLITEYEYAITPLVDTLRTLDFATAVDSGTAAVVAIHLSIRSAHTRGIILSGVGELANIMLQLAERPQEIIGERGFPSHRAPLKVEGSIIENIRKNNIDELTNITARTLARISYIGIREQAEQLHQHAKAMISSIVGEFSAKSKAMVADAHSGVLEKSLAPLPRVDKLRALQWTIVEHCQLGAILPDCVCIGYDAKDGWQPLFLSSDPDIVVLPLTPSKLVVGRNCSSASFEVAKYNDLAASACFDFFLTSEKATEHNEKIISLGGAIRTEMRKMTTAAVSDALQSYLEVSQGASLYTQDDQVSLLSTAGSPTNGGSYSYQISFLDCADEETARDVGQAIARITSGLAIGDAISRLDGITFADNYAEALRSIPRGFASASDLKPTESEFGIGVAMPVTVIRDGKLKSHLVLRGFLADNLIALDAEIRASASDTIRYLLASLVLLDIESTRFPSKMLNSISDALENFLYPHAGRIFDTYFATRISTTNDRFLNDCENVLADQVQNAVVICTAERRRYRIDDNLDGLYLVMAEQITQILLGFARVFGMRSALDSNQPTSESLASQLDTLEMSQWSKLFFDDLNTFFEDLPKWENFDEIFFLNRHFERWLLRLGVIIDPLENGDIYIHVPVGSDLEYLKLNPKAD